MSEVKIGFPLFSRWQCPKCNGNIEVSDVGLVCGRCGARAPVDLSQRRVEWLKGELSGAIASERLKYDQWSETVSISKSPVDSKGHWWNTSPGLAWAKTWIQKRVEDDDLLAGKRVLDIGGSCLDSWYFLADGADVVAQVEPSPGSQAVAKKRIQLELGLSDDELARVVEFHTAIAEALPFESETFDLVFSRSSIHHTARPQSLMEIERVLKPGGVMLMVEPIFPRVFYKMMWMARKVRRVDRGTDDPLTVNDIRMMEARFGDVAAYRYGTGLSHVEWLIRKLAGQYVR